MSCSGLARPHEVARYVREQILNNNFYHHHDESKSIFWMISRARPLAVGHLAWPTLLIIIMILIRLSIGIWPAPDPAPASGQSGTGVALIDWPAKRMALFLVASVCDGDVKFAGQLGRTCKQERN